MAASPAVVLSPSPCFTATVPLRGRFYARRLVRVVAGISRSLTAGRGCSSSRSSKTSAGPTAPPAVGMEADGEPLLRLSTRSSSTSTNNNSSTSLLVPALERSLNLEEDNKELRLANGKVAGSGGKDELWEQVKREARADSEAEPALASYMYSTILAHRSLERALAFHLGNKLCSNTLLSTQLFTLIDDTLTEDSHIRDAVRADIRATKDRDPACVSLCHCMLNFKGFLACQAHRVAHRLWNQGRMSLALAIQSRVSEVFQVDIHPAAKVGKGVLLDHATGVVVGETASIGDNVSILHHVTLGGTGACVGDRHPKIADGVLIGAGATLLGPIRIGEGAKIGAGSLVLRDVPAHCTAVGNPARLVGGTRAPGILQENPSQTMDHTSFAKSWSDYVI